MKRLTTDGVTHWLTYSGFTLCRQRLVREPDKVKPTDALVTCVACVVRHERVENGGTWCGECGERILSVRGAGHDYRCSRDQVAT